jgi:glyoxylase-like metal-dependent hydrolase (beta-lactamase superfamily II)
MILRTCYIKELPKLESYLNSISYQMSDIKRIILTHAHADHVQAANEVKKRTLRCWSKDIFSLDIMAHRILEFTRSY